MHKSLETIKNEIREVNKEIKECTDRSLLPALYEKQKDLCNAMNLKKHKDRMGEIVKRYKKAEAMKPIEEKQPVRIVIKEVPKEIYTIREVPIEVPKEIIIEKPVYVNHGGGIPNELDTDEYIALLRDIRNVYIKTHSTFNIGDNVITPDGVGVIRELHIDESELTKKGGGIFARVKRIKKADGKEGSRFIGRDNRGYKLDKLELIEDIKKYLNISDEPTRMYRKDTSKADNIITK